MPLDKVVSQFLSALQKYKVIAIVGVFLSFFVVITVLNFFQKATLEGFITLQGQYEQLEKFTSYNDANESEDSDNESEDE
jgi:hypothetical protein